jgi:hypothetical protein
MSNFERSVLGLIALAVAGLMADTLDTDPDVGTGLMSLVLMLGGLALVISAAYRGLRESE